MRFAMAIAPLPALITVLALITYQGPPEKDAVVAAQQRWLIASL
jgi:hypothetical protein